MRYLLFIGFILFSFQSQAGFHMQVDNINTQSVRFTDLSKRSAVMNFSDIHGQTYFLRCDSYLIGKSVHFQFLGNSMTTKMENCHETLEQIQLQLKNGKSIDYIEMTVSYQEGTKQDQLEIRVSYL